MFYLICLTLSVSIGNHSLNIKENMKYLVILVCVLLVGCTSSESPIKYSSIEEWTTENGGKWTVENGVLCGENKFKSTLSATTSENAIGMDSKGSALRIEYFHMTVNKLIDTDAETRIARHENKANVLNLDGRGKAKTACVLLGTNTAAHTLWDVSH